MIDFWGIGFEVAERMNVIPQLQAIVYLIDRVKFVNHCGRATSGFEAEILRRALGNRFSLACREAISQKPSSMLSQTRSRPFSATASLPFVKIEPASMFNSNTATHENSISSRATTVYTPLCVSSCGAATKIS